MLLVEFMIDMKYGFLCYALLLAFSCKENSKTEPQPIFIKLDTKSLGVAFENNLVYTEEFNVYLYRSFYNGAGTALADLNNDGFLDLFFCGNMTDNVLYLGDGAFNFKDVTQIAGVGSPNAWSTGVSIVDINQDGWLDIYICKSGNPNDLNRRNELFINMGTDANGVPLFKESAAAYGIDVLGFSVHAIFFDYDKDGDLDMYISNNSINPTDLIMDAKNGIRNLKDPGGGDKLFRNDDNFFIDVTDETGIHSSAIGFGLGIAVGDVNLDGWPDIYVANDFFEKDYLYMNNQNGTFTESIDNLTSELSLGSMGVDIADLNNDGYPEIFVTEMLPANESRLKTKTLFDTWDKYSLKVNNGYHRQFPRNALHLNRGPVDEHGNISFSEISRYSGVAATDWSWGVQMVDFDLDGTKEIFVTNGIVKDLLDQDYIDFYADPSRIASIFKEKGVVIKELIDKIPSEPIANFMFKQDQNLIFNNVASQWGIDQTGFSSGAAYGDIDNDGDLDLVVSNIDGAPFIYKNTVKKKNNHFVSLNLKSKQGTTAIGTKATISVNGNHYYQELFPMRGVMSAVDERINFGLGKNTKIDSLELIWPDGSRLLERNIPIDTFLTFRQREVHTPPLDVNFKAHKTLFTETTDVFDMHHVHKENDFVDFDREKLLYQMISNEGPKIAVGDSNGDGKDDFYIGGSKDKSGTLYVQTNQGFKTANKTLFEQDKTAEDIRSIFVDVDNDNDVDLLVSSGGYEFSRSAYALTDRLYINDGSGNFTRSPQTFFSGGPSSTSVIINSDFDADGYQDLFFGGRVVPLNYGLPVSSKLMRNEGSGFFRDVTEKYAKELLEIGMVTDAVWIDYDKDKDEDLVLVGDYMPIRVFRNDDGKFTEITEEVGLSNTNGFWNTIQKKDLDGDGWDDLIIGNLGENTFFKSSLSRPVQMYVNDFDKNGSIEQVITRFVEDKAYPFAMKKEITSQMPSLLKKYLKNEDYKEQSINNIFTQEELQNALHYHVYESRTVVLWNDKGVFSIKPLPLAAQLSPVYAIYADDFDNDGLVDLLLGGNQFNAKPQTGIYAANFGTVLKSIGNREFVTLNSLESGISIQGQIRDIKSIAIEGKKYLLIALNNDKLRLYEVKTD